MDLDLFIANADRAKKDLKWNSQLASTVAGLIFAENGLEYDQPIEAVSMNYLKKTQSAFSPFRGNMMPAFAAKMALEADGPTALRNVNAIIGMLNANGFVSTEFLAFAAWDIAARVPQGEYSKTVANMTAYHSRMAQLHSVLVGKSGNDDPVYEASIAQTAFQPIAAANFTEMAYQKLRRAFRLGDNSNLILAEIIAIAGDEFGAEKAIELAARLKSYKIKAVSFNEAGLGVAALISQDLAEAAESLAECYEAVRASKVFTWLGKHIQVSIASCLYASAVRAGDFPKNPALPASIVKAVAHQAFNALITESINYINAEQGAAAMAASTTAV